MTNELSTTFESLAHLLDIHHIGTVIARSRRTDERGVPEFDFTTNTIHRTWSTTGLDTGTTETNQNGLYTHFNRAGERVHEAKSPTPDLVPPAIRLCYPLDLPIWGTRQLQDHRAQNQLRPVISSTSHTHRKSLNMEH